MGVVVRYLFSLLYVVLGVVILWGSYKSLSTLGEKRYAINLSITGLALGGVDSSEEAAQSATLQNILILQYVMMLAGLVAVTIGVLGLFKAGVLRRFYWVPTIALASVGVGYAIVGPPAPSDDNGYLAALDMAFESFVVLSVLCVVLLIITAIYLWLSSRRAPAGAV